MLVRLIGYSKSRVGSQFSQGAAVETGAVVEGRTNKLSLHMISVQLSLDKE